MSVTVMPTLRTAVDYAHLPVLTQERFDLLMERANTTASNEHYRDLMARAATTAGIQLPPDGEIAKCACTNCYCCLIFDANHADARPIGTSDGYNLGRIQCPDCADRHRCTEDD